MSDKKADILITADSVCDLPAELREDLPIALLPGYVVTGEGRFVDGEEIDAEGVMIYMDGGKTRKKAWSEDSTAEDYHRFFVDKLSSFHQIIHISVGKKFSKGYENALEASRRVSRVSVVNSQQISSGYGLVVLKAARMAADGLSPERILTECQSISGGIVSEILIRDSSYLTQAGYFPEKINRLCERLVLYPVLKVRDGQIVGKSISAGQWKQVLARYIRRTFSGSWKIEEDVLFVTYANETEEQLDWIRQEVGKYIRFKHIYFQRISAALVVNVGQGTIGFVFTRKRKKKRREGENAAEKKPGIFRRVGDMLEQTLLQEQFDMHHKLMNIIILVAVVGGALAALYTAFLQMWESTLIAGLTIITALIALRLSMHQRPKLAGLVVCLGANVIFFPALFFFSGGMYSAMPLWFALGLVFDWLILRGWYGFGMYLLNYVIMSGVIMYAAYHPELVSETPDSYMAIDIVQGLLSIPCIFGAILQYQSRAYENQKKKLEEREQEILAASSAKDIFLANMSHEIRTPINGIIGMDTMLLRECGDNEKLRAYGKNIQSASQSLLSLVNDILDISKIESGKLEIIPIEYDLFSVLNDCYVMTMARIGDRDLMFYVRVNPSIPGRLYGDEVRLRQVINNILSNAVKYTPAGSVTMNVDMEENGDATLNLIIAVSDTGIGIRQEDREKLFESFIRVDQVKNRNIEGTGLGLNLTKNLVDMMNGVITVESVYGQGSTFIVRIPQGIRSRKVVGSFEKRLKEVGRGKEKEIGHFAAPEARILVVDDVPMNLMVVQGLLRETKMQVEVADSAKQAMEMVAEQVYDLILMDHLMPVMDGVECFKEMKKMNGNPNVDTPTVILTANAILGARENYLSMGFSDYLAKPIEEDELYRVLKKYLPAEKLLPPEMAVEEKTRSTETGGEKEMKQEKTDGEKEMKQEKTGGEKEMKQGKTGGEKETQQVTGDEVEAQPESFMDRLGAIAEIETETGLQYCMSSPQMYEEVVGMYLRDDRSSQLEDYLKNEDFKNYQVVIHAVKSTSLNIGARELSLEAKKLETACKEGNYDQVKADHKALMDRYRDLIRRLREVTQ